MSTLPATMAFDGLSLNILDHRGEPWLTARELASALGYRDESAVLRISSRNQDEFTEEMTCTVKLTVQIQDRETRIFSSRGCYAVGFFAKTDRAKAFRRWVLDVLEKHLRGPAAPPASDSRLMPLLALTRGRWGHKLAPNGYNAVSPGAKPARFAVVSSGGAGEALPIV
jgi:prophage antirepressor-like protein